MPRWLRVTGIGCGGLTVLFVVFIAGFAIGSVDTSDSEGPDETPALQGQQGEGEVPPATTEPQEQREPLTLSGTGSQVTEPIEFSEGLSIFEVATESDGYIGVDLIDENGENVEIIVGEIGPVDLSQGVRIPEDGVYRLNVEADGDWTVLIR